MSGRGFSPGALLGLSFWLAPVLFWAPAGCARAPHEETDRIARVGNHDISASELFDYLRRNAGKDADSLPGKVMSGLLDQLVDERLLLELARDRGLVDERSDPRAAIARLTTGEAPPTATAVLAHYQAHKSHFSRPERIRLRHVLVSDRAVADQAHRELAAGADFDAVVHRLAIEPLPALGGEYSRSDLPSVFADAVFDLPEGATSEVIEVDLGFHIFQVEKRLPARELSFEEAEAEARQDLLREQQRGQLERLLKEARNRYNPVIYANNLSFEYTGTYSQAPG